MKSCALFCIVWLACGCSREGPSAISEPPQAAGTDRTGVTVIDLSDSWTPRLFSESDVRSGEKRTHDFRTAFIALADERSVVSPTMTAAQRALSRRLSTKRKQRIAEALDGGEVHRYLEVFGIPPTLSVLGRRAQGELDRACFETIDFEKIAAFNGFTTYSDNDTARTRAAEGRRRASSLRREMASLGYATLPEYRANAPDGVTRNAIDAAIEYEALREAQRELVCEGLLDGSGARVVDGGLGHATHLALLAFERKNRIFGWGDFGGDTLAALARGPAERLYASLVRVITERVADAAGIIEDGTAARDGAPATYRDAGGTVRPLRNLVEELGRATLEQLDIATVEKGIAFLKGAKEGRFARYPAAVRLPALPPYYSDRMALSLEIDRGDVYYDYPYDGRERKFQPRKRTPTLTLFVTWRAQKIPLVTMGTSIGGWQDEVAEDGHVYLKYKGSEPGEGIIREIVAAPTWIPPESTPPEEILRTVTVRGQTVSVPDEDLIGPWYASAYGLVAAVHLKRVSSAPGAEAFEDVGIRSHGSYDYTSISRRHSHGCHRLHNHLAVRLYDFILGHSPHRRIGQQPVREIRRFGVGRAHHRIEVGTEGYVFELTRPIPVTTLEGTVLGRRRTPVLRYMPKPSVRYGPDAMFLER